MQKIEELVLQESNKPNRFVNFDFSGKVLSVLFDSGLIKVVILTDTNIHKEKHSFEIVTTGLELKNDNKLTREYIGSVYDNFSFCSYHIFKLI